MSTLHLPAAAAAKQLGLAGLGLTGLLLLSACTTSQMDWDLRSGEGALDTSQAALNATNPRPSPDARGVISYPGYQVAVAQKGDTVASVATRVGLDPRALADYNALAPTDALRAGEVLALPSRVAAAPASAAPGAVIGSTAAPGSVDVSTIATTALDRVDGQTPAPAARPAAKPAAATQPGAEPIRHRVQRGETAFSIARSYNISVRALAEWNGLGEDLEVREGQYLIIPTISEKAADPVATETEPGAGSPTPLPPSSKAPLPDEATKPAAEVKKEATPPSPEMEEQRTPASASVLAMPLDGKIIRPYNKTSNDGIDISAAAGSPVRAAADGTVALITKDTKGMPIVVVKHADGLLTGYAGVDGVKVAKGDAVKRGQIIAVLRAGDPAFLHFAVRKGNDSVDPMAYLQ